jgi:peptide/nickel transport system permease protein
LLRYLTRRIVFIILVLVFIVFAAHLAMRMTGNSERREPNFDMVPQITLAWMDTRAYLRDVWEGELGYGRTAHGPVLIEDLLKESYVNSMGLLVFALAGATILGLYLGITSALAKNKRSTMPILMFTILGVATPSFFLGLLLRQGELYYVRIFGKPLVSIAGFGWDYKHMLLPILVLAARPLAYLTRASFLGLSRVMDEDYIRTAYSKGLTRIDVVNIHAVKNLAIPVLTAIGVSLRFSLSTLPIVEFFFVWPGLGLRMLEAINMRQTTTVVTFAAALGITILGINLLLDIAYRIIDPRLRELH